MKHITFIVLVSIASAGCNNVARQFSESNTGADSVAINFFKPGGKMDTVAAVKIIRDKGSIEKMITLIASASIPANEKCVYDGSIHFFKSDRVVQDVFFSNSDGCRQFLFRLDGKDAATELDDTARDFLSTLKNK